MHYIISHHNNKTAQPSVSFLLSTLNASARLVVVDIYIGVATTK
jgi:hypothetical protein